MGFFDLVGFFNSCYFGLMGFFGPTLCGSGSSLVDWLKLTTLLVNKI